MVVVSFYVSFNRSVAQKRLGTDVVRDVEVQFQVLLDKGFLNLFAILEREKGKKTKRERENGEGSTRPRNDSK